MVTVEALWPNGQGLKARFQLETTQFLHEEVWVSILGEYKLCRKLEKMFTRDLQHGARSTVRNRSHRATQGDAISRESS